MWLISARGRTDARGIQEIRHARQRRRSRRRRDHRRGIGAIVNSLVGDVIMPLIVSVTGGLDFSKLFHPAIGESDRDLARRSQKAGGRPGLGKFHHAGDQFPDHHRLGTVSGDQGASIGSKAPEAPAAVGTVQGSTVARPKSATCSRPVEHGGPDGGGKSRKESFASSPTTARRVTTMRSTTRSKRGSCSLDPKSSRCAEARRRSRNPTRCAGRRNCLINSNIPEYPQASRFNHEPKRARKLLVHKREAGKLAAATQREGMRCSFPSSSISRPRASPSSSSASSKRQEAARQARDREAARLAARQGAAACCG